jgi:NTP pyrophosphatase (non-canonical NTP hydrolase)
MSDDKALVDVLAERERQEQEWGEQNHDPFIYNNILIEEVGELSQAALQTYFGGDHGGLENLRKEAVHTAAVALAIIQCLDRKKWKWPNEEMTQKIENFTMLREALEWAKYGLILADDEEIEHIKGIVNAALAATEQEATR